MRWWLILEEHSPELIYIKWSKNVVIDALSRLDLIFISNNNKVELTMNSISEYFALNKEDILQLIDFLMLDKQNRFLIKIVEEKPKNDFF